MSEARAPETRRRFPLYGQIIAAMAVGLVVGPLIGKDARVLGEIGKVVIDLIKGAATPLLFFAIVNAILKTEVPPRKAGRLVFWAAVNACIALAIGLLLSNLFVPGRTLAGYAAPDGAAAATYANKKIDLLATLTGFIPTNLVTPFQQNLVLSVVFLALLFGFGLRRVRAERRAREAEARFAIEESVETLLRLTEIVLGWVVKLIPLAVFGVVTRAVGEHGYGPLKGLFAYLLVGLGGLALHIGITYHLELLLLARMPVRVFWRAAKEPVIYAAGANSSLATLPITLRALDRLGVSRSSSVLGAGIGTNFNNDGIILYEGMALLFVAQAAGIDLSLGQQLVAAGACLITAMGVAGIPEAGFISLALVLNTVGLPIEILPLLLTTDWIIARGRSVTNVLSDMMLSILIDRNNRNGDAAGASTSRIPTPP
ncbi:MAG TPA: dicarboxylate/amino acid:cation symporter [Polyangia bacterium]